MYSPCRKSGMNWKKVWMYPKGWRSKKTHVCWKDSEELKRVTCRGWEVMREVFREMKDLSG